MIREVADLLESLRRLQDLAIAVEVRIVSLSEIVLRADGRRLLDEHQDRHDEVRAVVDPTGSSGRQPFVNDINNKGVTVGLHAGRDVHRGPGRADPGERASSGAIPPFGGYPNTPGDNGGLSLGLAFLNDIQVYMFMEAAQGDRRVNVMQAPKLTLFNGQTSTLTVSDLQFFVTSVQVFSVNGQIVFIPTATAVARPGARQRRHARRIARSRRWCRPTGGSSG